MNAHVHQRAAAAYGQAAQTIPPLRQIVMLYDGAILRLQEAKRAIAENRIEDRHRAVSKAAAIIDALHGCLDFERGGEVATHLDRFYTYVSFRMRLIDVRNDPSICDELIARLGEMRGSWAAIENSEPAATG
ncbi:MAG TPA: flagellar export chaperone FliS [Rhodospirillales bacterium]|nr:flagellar export chaperone FliS [Rhodospirillales bacterium]